MTKQRKHFCQPPVNKCCGSRTLHATKPRGTIWECECGKLWRVGLDLQFGDAWFRAGWLAQRRYRRQAVEPQWSSVPAVDDDQEAVADNEDWRARTITVLARNAGNGPYAAALYQSYMEGEERRQRWVNEQEQQ